MYGLELFAEVIFALVFIDILADGGAYLARKAHYFKFVVEALLEHAKALGDVFALQNFLLYVVADGQAARRNIHIFVGIAAPVHAGDIIFGYPALGRCDVAHYISGRTEISLLQREVAVDGLYFVRLRKKTLVIRKGAHAHAAQPLGEDAYAVRRKAGYLLYLYHGAHAADVVSRYFLLLGVWLGAHEKAHVAVGGALYSGERYQPARIEGYDRIGKYNPAAHGNYRYFVKIFDGHNKSSL